MAFIVVAAIVVIAVVALGAWDNASSGPGPKR